MKRKITEKIVRFCPHDGQPVQYRWIENKTPTFKRGDIPGPTYDLTSGEKLYTLVAECNHKRNWCGYAHWHATLAYSVRDSQRKDYDLKPFKV